MTLLFTYLFIRCDAERRARQDAEDRYAQLVAKLEFDCNMHERQVGELNERLANQRTWVACNVA
jgi:hypothetical protein